MIDCRRLLVFCLLLVAFSLAYAQPQTLNLEFGGDVYLSHVSDGLEAVPAYTQRSLVVTTRLDAEGNPTQTVVDESRTVALNGDRSSSSSFDVAPGMTMVNRSYVIGATAYVVGGMSGQLSCAPVPVEAAVPATLDTGVADRTGFKSATLAAAGETMNGVLADRYTLDDPPFAGGFEGGNLAGEVWIARDGGFIVKYQIDGTDSSGITTSWSYDLTDVGAVESIEQPEVCAGL